MFYREKKFMKLFLLTLFIIAGCSTMTQGKYKKEFHLEDFQSKSSPLDVHQLLTEKMTKCYPQSEYPSYEKTLSSFDQVKEIGTVYYEVDHQSMGPKILVLVEIEKADGGSLVKVYSQGDFLRSPASFKHHVHKWLDGKKVDCNSQGQI
jgi:hypothetical protein